MLATFTQVLINGIIAGSLYALLAIGLSLVYGILGFINFAHADIATVGSYTFYYTFVTKGWPLIPSIIAAIVAATVTSIIIKKVVYDPVKTRPKLTPMLTSIAAAYLIQSIIQMFATSEIKSIPRIGANYSFFDNAITVTQTQMAAVAVSIIVMIALMLFLKKTKLGKAIRAVSDNPQAAAIVGIRVNKIIATIFIIGGALAGIASVFTAYEYSIYPAIGSILVIKAFVPVMFGGVGNIPGTIVGAYAVGIIENFGIAIPFLNGQTIPASYKDAFAFIILFIILIFKPTGLFGERVEESVRKV